MAWHVWQVRACDKNIDGYEKIKITFSRRVKNDIAWDVASFICPVTVTVDKWLRESMVQWRQVVFYTFALPYPSPPPPYLCSSLAVQMRAENAFVIILLTYLYKQNAPEHGLSWLVTCVMCGQMQPEEAPRCRGEEEKGEHSGNSWQLDINMSAASCS